MAESFALDAYMKISLRACGPEDEAFLYQVYASTRADEMALSGWNEEQRDAFLKMQFNAQQRAYAWQFREAEHSIILVDEEMAGRLIVTRTSAEIRLTDITLLPAYRNKGAGTLLVKELQAQAREANLPLRLRVLKTNTAAKRLYERLGFSQTDGSDTHWTMEWTPMAAA
ncbi:MAG TPA: GNAT family N-acetyltransferase [Pyrinomonadaceae bacterium]|jgi:ribosomal protein S18 acetylase RimI-like enzyme